MTPQIITFGMIVAIYLFAVYITARTTPLENNGHKVKISRTNKYATIAATACGIAFDLNLTYLILHAVRIIRF